MAYLEHVSESRITSAGHFSPFQAQLWVSARPHCWPDVTRVLLQGVPSSQIQTISHWTPPPQLPSPMPLATHFTALGTYCAWNYCVLVLL